VKKFLLAFLPTISLCDQFPYRPTCSTTSSLFGCSWTLCYSILGICFLCPLSVNRLPYSKAFDTINHYSFSKIAKSWPTTYLPTTYYYILHTLWICNFLTGRTQSVSCGGVLSNWKSITASIIQSSGIGPSLFIIYSKDLKPLSVHNTILKFADDTCCTGIISTLCTLFHRTLLLPQKLNLHIYWTGLKK